MATSVDCKSRLIGITGGIATGKSAVTNYLQTRYNLPVWDADVYARSAVAVGSPILQAIVSRYGSHICQSDDTLDRRRLGEIVFNDRAEREWLEAQIHPYVRTCFEAQLDLLALGDTAVLAIPLLFEAEMTDLVTEIWVVSCDRDTQIQRMMTRDRVDRSLAELRIDSQMPLAIKIARSDFHLDNSTDLVNLYRQIDLLIQVA